MKNVFFVCFLFVACSLSAQDYKGSATGPTPGEKLNDQYCTGLFRSTDGTIIDMSSQNGRNGYLNALDWLDGRIAGLRVYNERGISIPVIRGGIASVYIDEVPVPLNAISSININDIAMVKVIKTPFYGGFNGGNGAIAIYTYDVPDEEEETAE